MKYICVEIDYRNINNVHVIHEIKFPPLVSGKCYRPIISLSYFRGGKRRYATKKDKSLHRCRCNWGPNKLYYIKQPSEFDEEVELNKKYPGMIKNIYGYDTIEEVPRIKHESIFDFYNYIGFDRKRRCYVDPLGAPIKFSVCK